MGGSLYPYSGDKGDGWFAFDGFENTTEMKVRQVGHTCQCLHVYRFVEMRGDVLACPVDALYIAVTGDKFHTYMDFILKAKLQCFSQVRFSYLANLQSGGQFMSSLSTLS